jgi:hypothetical protein
LGVLVAVMLLGGAAARADAGHTIVQRCAKNQSLAGFPPGAYAQALKDLSATTEEYSNCPQLIRQAQIEAASGHGTAAPSSATGTAAAIAATPAEQATIAHAAAQGSAPVKEGGQLISPGVVHANVGSAFSTLPTPVLVLLAFVLLCLAVFGANALRNRFRGGHVD